MIKKLKKVKVNLFQLLVILCTTGFIVFIATSYSYSNNPDSFANDTYTNAESHCSPSVKRMKDFKYVKPILFVDNNCEGLQFAGLKSDLTSMLDGYTKKNEIKIASIYLKDFQSNDYLSINETQTYIPASLMKVALLISILKMSENTPGFLDKQITYKIPYNSPKTQNILTKSIQLGSTYTVKELMTYMIKYSDNNATNLVASTIEDGLLQKVFSDFGLKAPDSKNQDINITCAEYSCFMRALFNGAYLTKEHSEYALELLTTSDFENGLRKPIPKEFKIASKFGESGNQTEKQLHESGIVYLDNKAYLLTVMTKGASEKTLEKVISSISEKVYTEMSEKTM